MAATLGLLGDDALNHVLAAYYQAKKVPCPWQESEVRKKDVHFDMIDKVARANKRLHKLSCVLRKLAIEKIRAAYFAEIVACALPLHVSQGKAFNRHLYHTDVSETSCFVGLQWRCGGTTAFVHIHLSHNPRHSKAASHAISGLVCKGAVEMHKLSDLPGYANGVSARTRETRFKKYESSAIPEAERTQEQREEAEAEQKAFEAKLLAWLDASFRDLNAHEWWRTRNHVDLGV